jgi:hypothetical protein
MEAAQDEETAMVVPANPWRRLQEIEQLLVQSGHPDPNSPTRLSISLAPGIDDDPGGGGL